MRIGILGDIHGAHRHLEIALGWLQNERPDAIWCVGDVCDGPGDLNRCIELLRENLVQTVRGNHDDWLLRGFGRDAEDSHQPGELASENLHWLRNLPLTCEFETPLGPVLLCHGVGENFMRYLRGDDDHYSLAWNEELLQLGRENWIRCLVNGHTHRRYLGNFGGVLNLNAGKLSASHEGFVGGVWLADFKTGGAQLRLFEGEELAAPLKLPFEQRFWETLPTN